MKLRIKCFLFANNGIIKNKNKNKIKLPVINKYELSSTFQRQIAVPFSKIRHCKGIHIVNISVLLVQLKKNNNSHKYHNIDIMTSTLLIFSLSQFIDKPLFKMCVVICTKTSNINVSDLEKSSPCAVY
jgi:hypothetical protein